MRFSRAAARTMLLAAQGLGSPPEHPATRNDLLDAIRRMGVLQIDSISVVARSPYLVLWSRLGAYDPTWLDELLAEGHLFEYWSHAACFIPIEDYGLYRRLMLEKTEKSRAWMEAHPDALEHVMERVSEAGPVRSAEFARTDGKAGGWWEWKPEKRALEHLFAAGELMISRRENFNRVYDLRERVLANALPGWDDALAPSEGEVRRTLAREAVRALGVAVARWVPDYFRTPKKGAAGLLEELADEGALLRAWLEDEAAYVHPENAGLAEKVLSGGLRSSVTTLLSPFDPVVWDRARALELFGFDYKIEVYTPAAKRRYGYYSLSILHEGALVGRLDAKAHRKQGVFEVKALHLEPEVTVSDDLVSSIAEALRDCAGWHGTPEILVRRSNPPDLAAPLRAAVGDPKPEAYLLVTTRPAKPASGPG
ncbi:Putative cytoplasmic protein clustered with trehalase [uncultured Rubrobacteraceae bacterium]|uniref:Cytoplasmic protein clustered with trehalase n=1 Tax=uncultured Rubrobacteraceae bacterium TaxID=349277 RepID=A0A6J4Q335_9ACTN|nr:Putative cytoplasmic protein clustered with trehalase [uncultured Rubrobacteraceae bacterium]